MPVCALHLVQLHDATAQGVDGFLQRLFEAATNPKEFSIVTVSQIQSPIIRPTLVDHTTLNGTPWTLLLVVGGAKAHVLPSSLGSAVEVHYSLVSGIPSKIVSNYDTISTKLREEAPRVPLLEIKLDGKGDVIPPANKSSSTRDDGQDLSLSPALLDLAKQLNAKGHKGPVSMLNLLHFHTQPGAVESYHEYGRRFATVAGRRGGNAKLVGIVIPLSGELKDSRNGKGKGEWWDECTLVHYPSINHFIDMSVDDEYQYINKEFRLKGIKDTALICTLELDLTKYRRQAKL